MESILLQKLYTTYGSFSNISSRIKEYNLLRIKRKGTIPLFNLAKNEGLLDEIGYTYEDFIIDYKEDVKGYKETKILFEIWCLGYSIKDYAKFIGVSYSTLSRGFINGFVGSYSTLLQATASIIFDNFDEKDIIDLKLDFGEGYCKLIGDNEKLKLVKEKYKIDYPILPYKEKLNHIAFDGPFYTYLNKYKLNNYKM
ncbi:hypothetical protein [Cetobacterium somerae]|uniref:hypothetical protein n=1 Tax=Cetobacterium somerae TaxID=188913 RepID=UPI0038926D45